MTDALTQSQQAILNGLSETELAATIAGDWDNTPDSVSYECPFADLHGCYRHAHEAGLLLRTTLLQANRNGK